MKYYSCVECKTANGETGTFISGKDRVPVSPVFAHLIPLYKWMKENGWRNKDNGEPWEVERAA